jgi:hypothetical protein
MYKLFGLIYVMYVTIHIIMEFILDFSTMFEPAILKIRCLQMK